MFRLFIIYYVYSIQPECMPVGQKGLQILLQTVVSHIVVAENWTHDLWKYKIQNIQNVKNTKITTIYNCMDIFILCGCAQRNDCI